MTTIQLGQRLCGYLILENLNEISAAETLVLVGAINSGLGEMQMHLPAHRFTSNLSFPIGAPRSETVNLTTGAAQVSNTIIAAGDVGKTLVFGGDPKLNEVVSTTAFLRPYSGVSSSQTMTLYDDAVPFELGDESIGSAVGFIRADTGKRQSLNVCANGRKPRALLDGSVQVGEPTECWIDGYAPAKLLADPSFPRSNYTQSEAMRTAAWLLRLWPLPGVAGSVEVELKTFDSGVVFSDLSRARQFRFSPIESAHLVALCAEALLPAGKIAEHVSRTDVTEAAKRARIWLRAQSGSRQHGQQTIGTREGY